MEGFLAWIAQQFADRGLVDPEVIARAVFRMLSRRVSDGEIEDVKDVLPAGSASWGRERPLHAAGGHGKLWQQ